MLEVRRKFGGFILPALLGRMTISGWNGTLPVIFGISYISLEFNISSDGF